MGTVLIRVNKPTDKRLKIFGYTPPPTQELPLGPVQIDVRRVTNVRNHYRVRLTVKEAKTLIG